MRQRIAQYESHLSLVATASAPFWARRHLTGVLAAWGIDLRGNAELVATEFVTNGIRASGVDLGGRWVDADVPRPRDEDMSYSERTAARPLVRMYVRFDAVRSSLVLAVWDRTPDSPVVQSPELEALGGRGLMLVAALCDAWGWYWPAGPVTDEPPWPRAARPDDGPADGAYGKVVWAAFTPRGAGGTAAPGMDRPEGKSRA